jgi:hypothetical protein
VVIVKPDGRLGEGVEIGSLKLAPAIGAEHVPVETVQQDDDGVLRCGGHVPPQKDKGMEAASSMHTCLRSDLQSQISNPHA